MCEGGGGAKAKAFSSGVKSMHGAVAPQDSDGWLGETTERGGGGGRSLAGVVLPSSREATSSPMILLRPSGDLTHIAWGGKSKGGR